MARSGCVIQILCTRLFYTDFGFGLGVPFDHAPIWFWGSAGKAFGEEDEDANEKARYRKAQPRINFALSPAFSLEL